MSICFSLSNVYAHIMRGRVCVCMCECVRVLVRTHPKQAWLSSISLRPRAVGRTVSVARSRSASRKVLRKRGSRASCTPHMYTARRRASAADPPAAAYNRTRFMDSCVLKLLP